VTLSDARHLGLVAPCRIRTLSTHRCVARSARVSAVRNHALSCA